MLCHNCASAVFLGLRVLYGAVRHEKSVALTARDDWLLAVVIHAREKLWAQDVGVSHYFIPAALWVDSSINKHPLTTPPTHTSDVHDDQRVDGQASCPH
jgi:hypothetical protein